MKEILTGVRKLAGRPVAKAGRINIRIDEEDLGQLVRAAELENVQASELARRAIRQVSAAILAAHQPEKPPRKKKS